VYGANFSSGSRVLWNGAARTTAYVSSTQLTAAISADDIAQPATALVSVANPPLNQATAAAQPFAVVGSAPAAIAGASLASASDGSGNYVLAVSGTGFVAGSAVKWQTGEGAPVSLPTAHVGPWQLMAEVTAAQYSALSSQPAAITVSNPAGESVAFTLQ
jgi:hypothetical protein